MKQGPTPEIKIALNKMLRRIKLLEKANRELVNRLNELTAEKPNNVASGDIPSPPSFPPFTFRPPPINLKSLSVAPSAPALDDMESLEYKTLRKQ